MMISSFKWCTLIGVVGLAVGMYCAFASLAFYPLCFAGIDCPTPYLEGTVASEYESVRDLFAQQFANGRQLGAQVAAYRNGHQIVNLFGGQRSYFGDAYASDTLQQVYSSGKMAEVFAMAWLVDRDLVRYEDTVAQHWPEFAVHGKQNITIAMVLQHRGGFPYPSWPWQLTELSDMRTLAARFAASAPTADTSDERTQAYHALTRGVLVNELVQRIDPKGRSIAELIKEEFATPLGVDWYIGLPAEQESRLSDIFATTSRYLMMNYLPRVFLPDALSRLLWRNEAPMSPTAAAVLAASRNLSSPLMRAMTFPQPFVNPVDMKTEHARRIPLSSALTVANANALAVMAEITRTGEFNGKRLLRKETLARAAQHQGSRYDTVLLNNFTMTNGGWGMLVGGYQGWTGLGGSLTVFDEASGVSFGFCMNMMQPGLGDNRARLLLAEIIRVAGRS